MCVARAGCAPVSAALVLPSAAAPQRPLPLPWPARCPHAHGRGAGQIVAVRPLCLGWECPPVPPVPLRGATPWCCCAAPSSYKVHHCVWLPARLPACCLHACTRMGPFRCPSTPQEGHRLLALHSCLSSLLTLHAKCATASPAPPTSGSAFQAPIRLQQEHEQLQVCLCVCVKGVGGYKCLLVCALCAHVCVLHMDVCVCPCPSSPLIFSRKLSPCPNSSLNPSFSAGPGACVRLHLLA